ncbi:MAG: prepilin-type N-terminal cleavage/methylation domain-containing protein [Candidatus Hydrogenedentota bacterium]|nr:MAG: prepilin-type N-terminal cleavage/methylation domain-containing protein [Candidatus Hydrogenedentota bacterium]
MPALPGSPVYRNSILRAIRRSSPRPPDSTCAEGRRLSPAWSGFTLAEVLVATAVLAVLTVGILGSLLVMTGQTKRFADDVQLVYLARALASDIALRGIPRKRTGSFDTHRDYHWTIEMDEPDLSNLPLGKEADAIRSLTLTVESPHHIMIRMRMWAPTNPR